MSTEHPRLTHEALAEMCAHAGREYPNECCGIVFGPRGHAEADRVRSCVNIQNELHAEDPAQNPRDARTAYNFGASDLFLLQKSLRGDAPAKIIYHSHVNIPGDGAYFSATDQAAACMGDEPAYPVEYVVIDIKADGPHGAAQFAWDEAQKSYVEVARYRTVGPAAAK
jgi:proteasome lid subunit RPN8/RPN11